LITWFMQTWPVPEHGLVVIIACRADESNT
jgi:hypothetical protein